MYVFLDWETYYDSKTYTLKSMSMEEYIRDPRFEAQLLGIAVDSGPVHIFEGPQIPYVLEKLPLEDPTVWTFAQSSKFDTFILSDRYGKYVANPICTRAMARWTGVSRLTRESQAALCEFLGTGVKGTFIENMSGKRLCDLTAEELIAYKAYCASDVTDLRANAYAMLPEMSWEAMEFIAMTTKMYTWPRFHLDVELLNNYYNKLTEAHEKSRDSLMHLFNFSGTEEFLKAIRSKKSFCKLLESLGGVVPYKKSIKKSETARKKLEALLDTIEDKSSVEAGTLQYDLANENYIVYEPALAKSDLPFMELMEDPDPNIAALATARAENNSSIAMSRTMTFLNIARRGSLPVPLEAYQAWTGRYTGGSHVEDTKSDGVNLQNLAKRTGDKTLRHAVVAPPGYMIVAGDSSQVEARMGAWIAGETQLVNGFAKGEDVYCDAAGTAYSLDPATIRYWSKGDGATLYENSKEHKEAEKQRNLGKEMILSSQYGIGWKKFAMRLLQQKLKLADSEDAHNTEAQRINHVYREKYKHIVQFWKTCDEVIRTLYLGGSGYFAGPTNSLFYFDSNHRVFGRKVPGIMFPNGYWLLYPNLRSEYSEDMGKNAFVYDQMVKGRKHLKYIYGGLLFNNLTQGMAAFATGWQALQINRTEPIALNVHDEWVTIPKEENVQGTVDLFNKWMTTPPSWAVGVPFACEVKVGRTYGQI